MESTLLPLSATTPQKLKLLMVGFPMELPAFFPKGSARGDSPDRQK